MYSAAAFEFTADAPPGADVTIDESTVGKQAVLARIADGLQFPAYFGKNWDALLDCLSDLSWLEKAEAIIDHTALPTLPSAELRLYLETLCDAVTGPRNAAPKLRVCFRLGDRDAVSGAVRP